MENILEMKKIFEAIEIDSKKFYEEGNASVGTRLRNSLQKIKTLAHQERKVISSIKEDRIKTKS